jgi:hypothetical protein
MYDATVDAQLNTLRWRNNEVINAMPRDPLNYKQPVAAALDRVVGVTSRRNGDVPDWVADAVCLQIAITRVPLKPPMGSVINGVAVDVQDEGLKTFVPIGIKALNIGKNTDLGFLLREFMRQQAYPFSTNPTAAELSTCRYTWINVDVGNFSRMYKVLIVLFVSLVLPKLINQFCFFSGQMFYDAMNVGQCLRRTISLNLGGFWHTWKHLVGKIWYHFADEVFAPLHRVLTPSCTFPTHIEDPT